MLLRIASRLLTALIATGWPLAASANEPSSLAFDHYDEPREDSIGLELELGLLSAFVWRGYNQLQIDSNYEQQLVAAPGATWSMGDSGLWLGWWSAIQLLGREVGGLIEAGIGLEQDLLVGYSAELAEGITIDAGLALYLYPFADPAEAGTPGMPWFVEPFAAASFETPYYTLTLNALYFGLLPDPRDGFSHLYLSPVLSQELPLSRELTLELSAGWGVKIGFEDRAGAFDAELAASLPLELGAVTLTPTLHLAWSNLGGRFRDGLAPWGGIIVSTSL